MLVQPAGRDSGNDFSFPIPSPFLKLNDNDVKSFLNGYPIFWSRLFLFPGTQNVGYFSFYLKTTDLELGIYRVANTLLHFSDFWFFAFSVFWSKKFGPQVFIYSVVRNRSNVPDSYNALRKNTIFFNNERRKSFCFCKNWVDGFEKWLIVGCRNILGK